MNRVTAFKAISVFRLILFSLIALALIAALFLAIDIINEGLMHKLTIFEREPKEGWDYWKWKAIKEALPSWIICGTAWQLLMIGSLYFIYRNLRNIFTSKSIKTEQGAAANP